MVFGGGRSRLSSQRTAWTRETVDNELQHIMRAIFETCTTTATEFGLAPTDLQAGANIGGFLKVARAMKSQGGHFSEKREHRMVGGQLLYVGKIMCIGW